MIHRIAILVHRHEAFDQTAYFVSEFARVWLDRGIEVVVVRGPQERVEADVAILHVDLTVIPPEYLALARRYPSCVNGHVADISKRVVSTHLVRPGDGYCGPVIVKSDRNYGGRKERDLALRGHLPPSFLRVPASYDVFESPASVAEDVWADRDLVVERFCPEKDGDLYKMRTWMFFGGKETGSIAYSPKPVVKSESVVHRKPLHEVPEELRMIREELAFEYGTFNYVMHEGEAVLFDANRAPALGAFSNGDPSPEIRFFADGIWDFVS
ncbi:MAG: hypothetical protein HZC36_02270 [Armatimonadetes bacterium]|nr:hypothetical protein [Armatimonadota bacterium]